MSTKATANHTTLKNHFIIRMILGTILVLVLAINSLAVFALWRQDRWTTNYQLGDLIMQAIDQRNKPFVIDPHTNAYYIPEARLVAPAPNSMLGSIVYNHIESGATEEVTIASQALIRSGQAAILNAQGDTEKIFAAVPEVQACARGVRISFAADTAATFTKTLKDGRTAHFYTEKSCYSQKLVEYVKQIDSY